MKLPVILNDLQYFLLLENVEYVAKFIRYTNCRELSRLTGIKYRRTCHILSYPIKMTDNEIEMLAKAIDIDKSYVAKFIAKR